MVNAVILSKAHCGKYKHIKIQFDSKYSLLHLSHNYAVLAVQHAIKSSSAQVEVYYLMQFRAYYYMPVDDSTHATANCRPTAAPF